MAQLVFALVLLAGGALQLYAAMATHRSKGQLRSQQARQLEALVGRRGTVVFFLIAGALLVSGGLWLATVASRTLGG